MGLFSSVAKGFKDAVEFSTGKTTLDTLGGGDFTSLIPGLGDAQAAAKQNAANIAAAREAMAFSERMSSTAYQRAMADMRKAGLNSTLAYMQGGASAPQGTTPTINSETKTGLADFALKSATGIGGLATAKQQADTQQASAESSIQLNQSSAAKQLQEVAESKTRQGKIQAETSRIRRFGPRDEAQAKLEKRATDAADSIIERLSSGAKSFKEGQQNKKSIFERLYDQATFKPTRSATPAAVKQRYAPSGYKGPTK